MYHMKLTAKTFLIGIALTISHNVLSENTTYNQQEGLVTIPAVEVNGVIEYVDVVLVFNSDGLLKIVQAHLPEDNTIDPIGPITYPFTDTFSRPGNIGINTVLSSSQNGLWIVLEGDYYAGSAKSESAYVYEDNSEILLSYLSSGVSFQISQMPDPSPIISSTDRPGNLNPNTILILSNGQIWKITDGSYYAGSTKKEDVIIYLLNGQYLMSFQSSGVVMGVERIN